MQGSAQEKRLTRGGSFVRLRPTRGIRLAISESEVHMANDTDPKRDSQRVLGDINSRPNTQAHPISSGGTREEDDDSNSMTGGSQHDRTAHAGSRDVTEGTSGGLGPEVGGTRNYRQGSGATGGDIGNRPE
jgi:hypothetical protein